MSNFVPTLDRKPEIVGTAPQRHTRLRTVAENLSRANADTAVCELMNEALARLVALAYEQDAGGFCNVDSATGRLLLPLPWGRNGHARWGIRPQESNILREVLFAWEQDAPALLQYDRSRRAWHINLFDYGSIHLAKRWLTKHQIGIAGYRTARAKRLG